MLYTLLARILAEGGPAVTPVDAASGDLVAYVLNYGILGILVLAFTFKLIAPYWVLKAAREEGRADLIEENKRLIAEKEKAEAQRDDALKVAQDQLVPMLISFNATVGALLPLLQQVVARQERGIPPFTGMDR